MPGEWRRTVVVSRRRRGWASLRVGHPKIAAGVTCSASARCEAILTVGTAPAPTWLALPEEHDYPAAASYLRLIFDDARVATLVAALRAAPISSFFAKDILRASQLPLLAAGNSHVDKDADKIAAATGLSPLLLVRDVSLGKVIVADGYHRLCAVCAVDDEVLVPCKLV
jgi:hypothetical protein